MKRKWTSEEAWSWYRSYPWLRGCNYIGSDCANRRDQWQSYGAEARFETMDRELALAEETGFNTVRLIMDYDVWLQEEESYMERLEKTIALCAAHGQYVMLVLSAEAELPHGAYDAFEPKKLGEQKYDLGYHQGRGPQFIHDTRDRKDIYHPMESPVLRESYLRMLREIVTTYAADERVICWNVYNEPGIILKERSVAILRDVFAAVRACDPAQPLAADLFTGTRNGKAKTPQETFALEESDVISFHSYCDFTEFCELVDDLRRYDRPLLCTEWLNRMTRNDVRELYPLMYLEKIANWCWGFVAGKTQTYEPWYAYWEQYLDGKLEENVDFTKWQHDLFRPSLLPYDPKEIELIRRVNARADAKAGKA